MTKHTEAELCRVLVDELADSWNVYQEVQVRAGGRVADLVLERGGMLWVIEVKRTLTWQLLDQALDWRSYAHLVTMATGVRRTGMRSGHRALEIVLRTLGLGLVFVNPTGYATRYCQNRLRQVVRGRYQKPSRHNAQALARALVPEQQTWCEAGSPGGGHWTPFKATVRRLAAHVQNNPGVSLRDAFGEIEHHYSSLHSACGAMRTWLLDDMVPGVHIQYRGRTPCLYPDTDPPTPRRRA